MKNLHVKLATLGLLLICTAVEAAAEVVVVVGSNSPIQSLSRHDITDIFLGNATSLPNVGKVIPLDRSEDRIRAEFYQDYTGRNLPQVKSHWAKNIFTGRGYPPKAVSSIDELKEVLQRYPNAISYINENQADDTLKILKLN
ncbi:MAG TPA: hypothetical protein VD810_04350 [Methylophilaceae bacterium]|nr:hypothetical protein [Methylophilaceae bacterium]